MGELIKLGAKSPEQQKPKRSYVGKGVCIWMKMHYALVISGNVSGLVPVQAVFPELFGKGPA